MSSLPSPSVVRDVSSAAGITIVVEEVQRLMAQRTVHQQEINKLDSAIASQLQLLSLLASGPAPLPPLPPCPAVPAAVDFCTIEASPTACTPMSSSPSDAVREPQIAETITLRSEEARSPWIVDDASEVHECKAEPEESNEQVETKDYERSPPSVSEVEEDKLAESNSTVEHLQPSTSPAEIQAQPLPQVVRHGPSDQLTSMNASSSAKIDQEAIVKVDQQSEQIEIVQKLESPPLWNSLVVLEGMSQYSVGSPGGCTVMSLECGLRLLYGEEVTHGLLGSVLQTGAFYRSNVHTGVEDVLPRVDRYRTQLRVVKEDQGFLGDVSCYLEDWQEQAKELQENLCVLFTKPPESVLLVYRFGPAYVNAPFLLFDSHKRPWHNGAAILTFSDASALEQYLLKLFLLEGEQNNFQEMEMAQQMYFMYSATILAADRSNGRSPQLAITSENLNQLRDEVSKLSAWMESKHAPRFVPRPTIASLLTSSSSSSSSSTASSSSSTSSSSAPLPASSSSGATTVSMPTKTESETTTSGTTKAVNKKSMQASSSTSSTSSTLVKPKQKATIHEAGNVPKNMAGWESAMDQFLTKYVDSREDGLLAAQLPKHWKDMFGYELSYPAVCPKVKKPSLSDALNAFARHIDVHHVLIGSVKHIKIFRKKANTHQEKPGSKVAQIAHLGASSAASTSTASPSSASSSSSSSTVPPPKPALKSNPLAPSLQPFTCTVCQEDCEAENVFIALCCNTQTCRDCTYQHVTVQLGEQKMPCCLSNKGCKEPLRQGDLSLLLNETEMKRFLATSLKTHMQVSDDYRSCETANCPYRVAIQPGLDRWECDICHATWCASCKTKWHENQTCEAFQKSVTYKQEKEKSLANIGHLNMKVCPRCHVPVEKIDGCNAMMCQCKCAFCFLCGKDCGVDAHPHFGEKGPCFGKAFEGTYRIRH